MKSKAKILLGSTLTIAMCASLITGSTLALFTSEAKTNIAVTSGKVEVTATIGDLNSYHLDANNGKERVDGSFGNGGTSAAVDGSGVTLTNFTPLDGLEVPVTVTNSSSVAIKYQIRITSIAEGEKDIFDALQISLTNSSLATTTLGKTTATDWQEVTAGGSIAGFTVDIFFPDRADNNEYKDCKGNLNIQVMAVQGNAATTDPSTVKPTEPDKEEKTSFVFNYDQLADIEEAFEDGENYAGKTIELMDDIDLEGEEWTPIAQKDDGGKFQGIFDGHGHTISGLLVSHGSDGGDPIRTNEGSGLFGYVENATIKNLTIDGASVTGGRFAGVVAAYGSQNTVYENVHVKNATINGAHYVGALSGYSLQIFTATDCSVENCTVNGVKYVETPPNGNYNTGDKVGGLVGDANGGINIQNCVVADTTIRAWRDVGGLVGITGNDSLVIEKTTVRNTTIYIDHSNAEKNQDPAKDINARKLVGRLTGDDVKEAEFEEQNTLENVNFKLVALDLADVGVNTYVATKAGLAQVATNVNEGTNDYGGKTVVLTENIDFGGAETPWTPIGYDGKVFRGVFDGNGYTISNIYSVPAGEGQSYWRAGLFGEANATIKNLTLINVTAKGAQAGALIGHSDGYTLENITLGGTINVSYVAAHSEGYGSVGLFVGVTPDVNVPFENYVKNVRVAADCVATIDIAGTEKSGVLTNKSYKPSGDLLLFGYLKTAEENLERFVTVEDGAKVVVRSGKVMQTISDTADLLEFCESVNSGTSYSGKKVTLLKDIDFKGSASNQWTPIGAYGSFDDYGFQGTFDGRGHTISGIYINQTVSGKGNFSFFGFASRCTIQDLIVEGKITLSGEAASVGVGGICAKCGEAVTIQRCVNRLNIDLSGLKATEGCEIMVGGIAVGGLNGKLVDCVNEGDIIAPHAEDLATLNNYTVNVGGIMAIYMGPGTDRASGIVERNLNMGTITYQDNVCRLATKQFYGGGISGSTFYGMAPSCYNLVESNCSYGFATNLGMILWYVVDEAPFASRDAMIKYFQDQGRTEESLKDIGLNSWDEVIFEVDSALGNLTAEQAAEKESYVGFFDGEGSAWAWDEENSRPVLKAFQN